MTSTFQNRFKGFIGRAAKNAVVAEQKNNKEKIQESSFYAVYAV